MKLLIAPDSFKESLAASDVCRAIQAGFCEVFPNANVTLLPMADGGEGTSEVLAFALGGSWHEVLVHDPLLRPIRARYLMLANKTALIETASACGLPLLASIERNPMLTSSFGVGELINAAINNGAERLIIGLGGSATNDGGAGMLQALGMKFFDGKGKLLPSGGGALINLARIDSGDFALKDIPIEVASDVINPLCGKLGASAIFAPQKGASAADVIHLDNSLSNFASVVCNHSYRDFQNAQGAGAAGGLGFALLTFLNAQMQSGFEIVAGSVRLAEHIKNADLVITGEGKLDAQSLMGKVAVGVANIAKAQNKPVIAICGGVDNAIYSQENELPFDVILSSIQRLDSPDIVFASTFDNLKTTAKNLAAALKLGNTLA